jgi:protein-tyrosine phosphatase
MIPDLLTLILGVQMVYLRTALDEMRSRLGAMEGYFVDGLGLDAADRQSLHATLVA